MKTFESFRVAGFGDLGDPKIAQKKLIKKLNDHLKMVKKGNYSGVINNFDKGSVEFAIATTLEKNKKW